MRASFNNLRLQFKKAPRVSKILSLAVSLLGLVVLLVLVQTGIQFLSSFAQVAPSVRFDSSSYTLTSPSSTSVRVLVEPGSYQIGFVRVEVIFDTSKVRLSNEVGLSSTLFTRSLFVSTRDQANTQGKVIIALGLDPTQRTNPPTQTFELAQLFFNPATSSSNQTSSLSFNLPGMQIVNFSYTKLSFTTQSANLIINPTTTPTPTPTPRPTNTPTPTPTPTPTGPTPTFPPPGPVQGIWTSPAELAGKPMSGSAWNDVKSAADASWGSADLANQDSHHPQYVLAGAIVYARTGQSSYRDKVISGLRSIIGTEAGSRSLALGRNLAAYAVAADLVGYQDASFKDFLSRMLTRVNSEGRSLITCHEVRPNNWGTMCGASRIAIDLYIGNQTDLGRAVQIYKGYIGDRSSYASFVFQSGASSWMCPEPGSDPPAILPRPVNPIWCSKDGHDLSGAPVDDVQRGGTYTWPPNPTHYAWGGFSAAVAQAEMLHRAGYPAYEWEDQAIRRGMKFLQEAMASSASNPTDWMPWVVNHHYGTNFPATTPTGWGRLMAWTDFTHSR